MLYPICPNCGALLGNIQLAYQEDMQKLCDKYNVDYELLSMGFAYDEKFNKEKEEILNKYTEPDRYCCRMKLTNFSNIVELVH